MEICEMQEIANNIVEMCKEKRMTFSEAVLTLDLAKNYIYEKMENVMGEVGETGKYKRRFTL